ncbi:MAG: TonB family protein [Calditerrivibrio sp.]|nr:TonB family protein [Calditerrivibrio sp.]
MHLSFLYFIKTPKNDIKREKKPINVDIIKKTPMAKQTTIPKLDKKPLKSDKSIDKPIIIPDKFTPKGEIPPEIPEKGSKEEKKIESIPIVEKKDESEHKIDDSKKVEDKNDTKKEVLEDIKPNKDDKKNISRDQLAKILNPKDVINNIANKKDETKEDEVNFNKFEIRYTSYFYKFRRQLYNVWKYPQDSILKGEQGTVRIKFSILKDGTITNINVVSGSGYSSLDRAATDALKSMGKVPLPDSFDLNILNVDGYFIYSIGGVWIR